jgi:hypothetical protein
VVNLRSIKQLYLYVTLQVLDHLNIPTFVIDKQTRVLEGSANAIPRRVMVSQKGHVQAMTILYDAQSVLDASPEIFI